MNIETDSNVPSGGIPIQIPESYQKAIQDNSPLLEQLFGVGSTVTLATSITTVNSGEPEVYKTLLHFLDVYIEIFDYSSKQQKCGLLTNPVIKGDSPVLQQCLTKFREIWRQGFRGFQYLSEKKLEQISKRAELEALMLILQGNNVEMQTTLKEIMSLELGWIRRINEHKRNKDLDVIQMETVDKFKTAVVTEFPYLFDQAENGNNLKCCEDSYFDWKLEEIIGNCQNSFKAEIPFKEEETEEFLNLVLNNLNTKLDEMIIDLKSRNASKKITIHEYMDLLVDKCVETYTSSITKAVLGEDGESTQVQFDTEASVRLHKQALEKSTPKFITETGIEIGTNEYQIKCLNTFNRKTYEIFRNLVENLNENCQTNMVTCHQETKEEIQACLANITEILGRYKGMIGYSNVLRSQFESGLESIFGPVKETNRLNKERILTATKPVEILTQDEVQFKNLMETSQKIYSDKLLSSLQESLKYPNCVDSDLLETCHQKAKTQSITQIRLEAKQPHCQLSLYLSNQLEVKFCEFVNHFISKCKADVKGFIDYISGVLGTSIPFKPVTEYDHIIRNGQASKVTTLHQAITVMKEYEDKSFEELRLEDKLKKCLPSQKITQLLEESVSYFKINEDFQKSLTLNQAIQKDPEEFNFAKKALQFSPPPKSPFPFSPIELSRGAVSNSTSSSPTNGLTKPRRVNKVIRRCNH